MRRTRQALELYGATSDNGNRMTSQRIQKLRDKHKEIALQIKNLEARTRDQDRKDDTRRKIIVGALALENMAQHPGSEFSQELWKVLNRWVGKPRKPKEKPRPQDRVLLNRYFKAVEIPELPVSSEAAANDLTGEFKKPA